MTQVNDVAPGPLIYYYYYSAEISSHITTRNKQLHDKFCVPEVIPECYVLSGLVLIIDKQRNYR